MKAEATYKLSQTLKISIAELLTTFSDPSAPPLPAELIEGMAAAGSLSEGEGTPAPLSSPPAAADPTQEYQRLQAQMEQQRTTLQQEFQQTSLQILESWMLQFPTAAYAAQENPQIPATQLLPLIRPVEQLLQSWGVEAIATVGTELAYDPQLHELIDAEREVHPGDRVKVRYVGYRQGDKLLHRAKVSPIG
jgi:hypothetical protein